MVFTLLDRPRSATSSSLHAFFQPAPADAPLNGWQLYDPRQEFIRMGVGGLQQRTAAWRWSNVNEDFEVCPEFVSAASIALTLFPWLRTVLFHLSRQDGGAFKDKRCDVEVW